MTTLGLASAALLGGVELAMGALIGAGVTTLLRRSNSASMAPTVEPQQAREPEPEPEPAPSPSETERAHGLRARAIAVIRAARGHIALAPQPKQAR
ncbi:MAG TPA: hypothetical protein VIV11_10265 [Kofleriaceae bacterium]